MGWYVIVGVIGSVVPPFSSRTVQKPFYAERDFALKVLVSWSGARLFSFDASTNAWTEVNLPVL